MTTSGYVHWEEGLFLRPHHLQLMQRQTFEHVAIERRFFHAFPYGVIESRISRDELRNMLVRFDRLRLIMPGGLYVDVPGNAELPPLDIARVFEASPGPLNVYLAVPLWYATRANTIGDADGDWRAKRLYRLTEVEAPDENTGENPQPVRLRRINARLLMEGDDQTDFEVLPVLRIAHGVGEEVGVPREDPAFVPPCLGLRGSNVILTMLRDLANAVDASRRELVVQMTRGGFSVEMMRGVQFEQMLRLQTLSRSSARLPYLVDSEGTSLFELYLELRELLAELSALQPDRDLFGAPDYDHDQPFTSFSDLVSKIRSLLRGAVAPSFIRVEFSREEGVFVAQLSDEHFEQPTDYYLAIRTKEDPIALGRLVGDADKFKLMPQSMTGRAIRGLKLVEERQTPLQLPADADLHYFRLVRADSARAWERVQADRSMTAQWPNCEVADVHLTLYMTIANPGISRMNLHTLCEPLFLYVCRLNRSARKTGRADFRQTRAEIESLVNDMNSKAAVDPGLASQYGKIKVAIVGFVDSMIAESELPFAAEWHQNRLAYELDRLGWADQPERALDEKFFDFLEETLEDRSDAAAERLAILYTCLGLGFTGWYAGQPEYLKAKMMECAVRLRQHMDPEEITRICPQAYEHVDRGDLYLPPGTKLVGIVIALVVLILLVFAVNFSLYSSRTGEMETALEEIQQSQVSADGATP